MRNLEWFAITKDYGSDDTYGSFTKKYIFKKTPRLLDIGNGEIREKIEDTIMKVDPDSKILEYSDPDVQYSGGKYNERYHILVKKYFKDEYDGTIIDENHLKKGERYSTEDLEGPSEIVLWGNYTDLLDIVISSPKSLKKGGKKGKKKNKKRKTRKNKRII
jgi:hypothetical protein